MKFKDYKHKLISDDGQHSYIRHLIVIENEKTGELVWTDLHKYLRYKSGVTSISSNDKNRILAVIKFLNYIFFDKKLVNSFKELKKKHVQQYFDDYGLCKIDDHVENRSKETIEQHFAFINDFIECLSKNKLITFSEKDMYITKEKYNPKLGRITKSKKPAFTIYYKDGIKRKQVRDINNKVFPIFMSLIINKFPEILINVALEAFAGLRPAETCNVRREDSKLGPGIVFERVNGEVRRIAIHIDQKYVLRSDLVNTGGIKRKRTAWVYPDFINPFMSCYDTYMKSIDGKVYESEFGPLAINKRGMAMTYKSYYLTFRKAVRRLVKILLKSDDPELLAFAQSVQEGSLNPHALRHWFSVNITLLGATREMLKKYRGDAVSESADVYLANKGDLEKEFGQLSDEIMNYQSWKAIKLHDRYK